MKINMSSAAAVISTVEDFFFQPVTEYLLKQKYMTKFILFKTISHISNKKRYFNWSIVSRAYMRAQACPVIFFCVLEKKVSKGR